MLVAGATQHHQLIILTAVLTAILTAVLTQLSRLHQRKVAVKTYTIKVVSLARCYKTTVLCKPIILSYSNRPNFSIFSLLFTFYVCTATCPLDRVRAAAKISAGGVGSPYNQLYYTVSYPTSSTNYSSEDI